MLRGLTDSHIYILDYLFKKHCLKIFLGFFKLRNLLNFTIMPLSMLVLTHLTFEMKEITAKLLEDRLILIGNFLSQKLLVCYQKLQIWAFLKGSLSQYGDPPI